MSMRTDSRELEEGRWWWWWRRVVGGLRMANGWVRHGANRPQTRRANSTSPIIHTAFIHSRGIMGFLGILFLPSLSLFVIDSYLHWLTLRELAACWEEGGAKLIDCPPAGWWLAWEETVGPKPAAIFLPQCPGNDKSCWNILAEMHGPNSSILTLSFFHKHVGVDVCESPSPPPLLRVWGVFFCCYKCCLHAPKAEIRIRWSWGAPLNKAFRWLNYWTNRDVYLQQNSRAWWSFWTQQQNQSCIKLCVPIICSSLLCWTCWFFFPLTVAWLVNNGYSRQNTRMLWKWRQRSWRIQQDRGDSSRKVCCSWQHCSKPNRGKNTHCHVWFIADDINL